MSDFVNIVVYVSNTYNGRKKLYGVIKERENIIYALGLNPLYNDIIKSKFEIIKKNREDIRYCFLNDCTKNELISFLTVLKTKYNYFNIMLCLSGHGCNSSGMCSFQTQDNQKISLFDIISQLNTDSLKNITVLLDMCRSGLIVNENFSTNFVNLIRNKRVVVITPVRRGQKTQDTTKGGYLIQSLVKTIQDNQDLFIKALFSFQDTIRFVKYIVANNIELRLIKKYNITLERFLDGIIINKNPVYKIIHNLICEQFPSIYISAQGMSYLQRYPKQREQYEIILYILKRRVSDLSLEEALGRTLPTVIREK